MDSHIKQGVYAELRWDAAVRAAKISVEVREGVVTLYGEVVGDMQRAEAGRAAMRAAGVRALTNEIKLKQGEAIAKNQDIAGPRGPVE